MRLGQRTPARSRSLARRATGLGAGATTLALAGALAANPAPGALAAPTAQGASAATTTTATNAAANTTVAANTANTVAAKGSSGGAARRYLGTSASRLSWHSGAWVGGWMNAKRATAWGTWRGTPSDTTITFPEAPTWAALANSTWHIDTFRGFKGRLVYGLPMLPTNAKPAQLRDVAAGKHDAVFRKLARDLRTRGRGNSIVKIGWEANGYWMSFSATAATAPTYRAAWRRIAQVMAKESPALVFSFEVNCGTALKGQKNRLDSLTKLYPGNDVVDLVGCSTYDWWITGARNEKTWRTSIRPPKGPGIADVASFARAKRKGLSISEWGLATKRRNGNGDNPFYIRKMKQFFDANADILVLEQYFNEPAASMGNSLWPEAPQNPKAAAVYRQLW